MRTLILDAKPEDSAVIYQVMQAAYQEYIHLNAPSGALKETRESIENKLVGHEENALIIYDKLVPVGSVRYKLEGDSLYFFRLSIVPEARGKGYAQQLINELERIATYNQKSSIYCKVRKSIEKNMQLYTKLGYVVTAEETIHKPEGIILQVVTMAKQLADLTNEAEPDKLELVKLSPAYKSFYFDMIADWHTHGERINPAVLRLDTPDINQILIKLYECENGINLSEGNMPHSTYFLLQQGSVFIGAINLRHDLNERLLLTEGHIGGGIRPSERKKGYATQMLKLALQKIKEEHQVNPVLVTCNKGNIGSEKAILQNGGTLENEILEDNGNTVLRYWVHV